MEGTEYSKRSLIEEADEAFRTRQAVRAHAQRSMLHYCSWVAQLILFFTSVFLLLSRPRLQERCIDRLSSPSPILAAVDDHYPLHRFSGHVLANSSIYRGRPTPERIAAWDTVANGPTFRLNHAQLQQIGSPENSVRASDGDGYIAWPEVFHQMHCLQEIWKNTWPDFYHPDAGTEDAIHRKHLDHCVDMLRQKLMCDSDASVITYNWVKNLNHPSANFNVLHKCRNFDQVYDWVLANEVPMPKVKPMDAIELADFP